MLTCLTTKQCEFNAGEAAQKPAVKQQGASADTGVTSNPPSRPLKSGAAKAGGRKTCGCFGPSTTVD